jgi:cell division protein FtsQ
MTMLEMDPRIEARRADVRREVGRKRLRVLVLVAVLVVVTVGSYLTVESPFLDVDHVDVTGAIHLTPARVRAAAAIEPGRALLRVDLGAVARRVEQLPWVARARVRRSLPGTLRIQVVEAKPVGFVSSRGRVAVIGPDDRVIAWTRSVPAGAVEITGVRQVPARGQLLSPAGTARVIAALPAEIRLRVRSIALRPASVVVLLDAGEVRIGAVADLPAKFSAALAVMHSSYATRPFEYIDVSVPTDPVSKP